jgi:hypothetical protein
VLSVGCGKFVVVSCHAAFRVKVQKADVHGARNKKGGSRHLFRHSLSLLRIAKLAIRSSAKRIQFGQSCMFVAA